jgi:hypothetical protein
MLMPNLWSAEKYGHYFSIVICKNNHASYRYFVQIVFAESQFLMATRHMHAVTAAV